MPLVFSKDQTKSLNMLKKFVKSGDSFASIVGSAGTGKTTMISAMPEVYDPERVIATGPTNKCVAVLRDKIPEEIECVTIHRFLGLGVKNVKDKKVSYRTGTYDPTEWAHIKVVLVDESSMLNSGLKDDKGKLVGKGLCDFIREDAAEFGRKYIIMGDDCFTGDVEIMTSSGFVRFDELKGTEVVAQYDSVTGAVDFVPPLRYVSKDYEGSLQKAYSDKLLDVTTTLQHDFLCYRGGVPKKIKAEDLPKDPKVTLKVAGKGVGPSTCLTLMEKLSIAYQADGYTRGAYTSVRFDNSRCTLYFSFKKKRKVKKFLEDFDGVGLDFREGFSKYEGVRRFSLPGILASEVSKDFYDVFDITSFSQSKAQEFLEYVQVWDGFKYHNDGIGYSNTNKSSVDFVQQVAVLAGYKATVSDVKPRDSRHAVSYKVHILKGTDHIGTQNLSRKMVEHFSGKVYCVTVPKGNIIVRRSGKVVVIGNCQLPPVEGGQTKTEAFSMAKPEHSVVMAEIVRQAAGNPIIMSATLVRDAIKSKQEPKIKGGINEDQGTGVELLKRKAWLERLEEYVGDPRIHTDVDFCRVIAWTNDAVKNHNAHIRAVLGADTSRPFDLGDVVVVNEAVEKGFTIVLSTGQEVRIETMRESKHPVRGFKEWSVTLQGFDLSEPLKVLDESSRPDYLKALDKLRKQCVLSKQWQPFYGLKNYYADLRPPYAITAHKSQGSTFENVFIDLKDIYSNRNQGEADKCYYVAITRASRKVFVLV